MNLRELLAEAPLPAEWDQTVFTPATSYKKRIEYAVARAQRLGTGSSRTAFEIQYDGRPTVLKVAHNRKGMAQNAAESELLDDGYLKTLGIVIPLIDYDEDHTQPVWLHLEKAQKASEKQLCELMKCGKLAWLVDAAMYAQTGKGSDHKADIIQLYGDDDVLETFHEYVDSLQELHSFKINLNDYRRAANWGIFNGSPVVIDLGFTYDVAKQHYGLRESEELPPALRTWFGNSIVVDDNGNPLPMYHGSASDISKFTGYVNWFSRSPKFASDYADMRDYAAGQGGNVTKAYIKAERPFDADKLSKGNGTIAGFVTEMARQAADNGIAYDVAIIKKLLDIIKAAAHEEESGPHYSAHQFWFNNRMYFGGHGSEAIKKLFAIFKFDSIQFTEDGEFTIGVFSPNQIKSAISNVGTYSDDSDITKETYS